MINIANGIKLFDKKIEYQAIRSNGPGGQHVNKVSTAIILKYNLNAYNYPEWFLKSIKINANNAQLSNKNIIEVSKHIEEVSSVSLLLRHARYPLILLLCTLLVKTPLRNHHRYVSASIDARCEVAQSINIT